MSALPQEDNPGCCCSQLTAAAMYTSTTSRPTLSVCFTPSRRPFRNWLTDSESQYARQLWERIRHEFPELRIYTFWDRPIGPHPVAMFEVNLFTPAQFGAFIPWLSVWRGPLSVLIHPNTTEEDIPEAEREVRNHTQRAIWMGEKVPLDVARFGALPAGGGVVTVGKTSS